jgi:CrcB protein
MLATLLLVALGGAIGSVLRFGAGLAAARLIGTGLPWGTLAVNVAGSFLIGVAFVLLAERGQARAAAFVMTGLLGGFTTFSAFSLETLALWSRGAGGAVVYAAGTFGLCLAAVAAGVGVGRTIGGGV